MFAALPELAPAYALLGRAERLVRLLDRVVPLNAFEERRRLLHAWTNGQRLAPSWHYPAAPRLSELRAALSSTARRLAEQGALGACCAARALELEHEAAMVEAIGTQRFASLARARYAPEPENAELRQALDAWLGAMPLEAAAQPRRAATHLSDDAADPESLLAQLTRALGARRLPFRVVVLPGLTSLAATAQDAVLVTSQRRHTAREAARVVEHELEAHVLPRVAALSEPQGLLRLGFAAATEDEEGRALLIEARAGYLDAERRRELALRHAAATLAHAQAGFGDIMDFLRAQQVSVETALRMSERALRGGGLGREAAYVPAYWRVRRAFASEPGLERYFERGRVSVAAARCLAALARVELGDHGNMV